MAVACALGCGGRTAPTPPPQTASTPPVLPPGEKVESPDKLLAAGQVALRDKDLAKTRKILGDLLARYPASAEAKRARRPYVDASLAVGEYVDAVEVLKV